MRSSDVDPLRRTVVGGLGMGMATAMSGAARAQQTASASTPTASELLRDYPKPPSPKQTQEWPGLASKMDPRPDHGEDSYRVQAG